MLSCSLALGHFVLRLNVSAPTCLFGGGEDLNISLYIKVKEESCDGK